jgi:hypothetical protein
MKRKLMKTATMLASPDLHAGRKAVRKSATKAGKWAMKRMGRNRGPDYTSIALRGLGAVAITLPIGYLIGRRFMSHSTATH